MTPEQFQHTVLEEKDRLFSYACYLLGDRRAGEDVAQESLVRLWKHRERVPTGPAARAWLSRTAYNLCMDQLRLRRQRPRCPEEVLAAIPDERLPAPDDAARAVELRGEIRRALERLSPKDRAVVLMREVQGLSYEEIARQMDLPMGTMKALLHRARERLRRHLALEGIGP